MPAISRQNQRTQEPYPTQPQQRNTARRSTPLRPNYEQIKNIVENAIINRHNEPPQLYTRVTQEDTIDMVEFAKRNISIHQFNNTAGQFRSYYQMGYALQLRQENHQELTERESAEYLGLNPWERRIAKRTFNIFQHWPSALKHLGNLSPRQWENLRNIEEETLLLHLLGNYLVDNNRIEETDTSISGSDTEEEIHTAEIINTVDTIHTAEIINTVDTIHTAEIINTVDTIHTAEIINTVDTIHTAEIINTVDTINIVDILFNNEWNL
jgi:hypothetical protein